MKSYDPAKIEKKWQKFWDKKKVYQAKDSSPKKKFYSLMEFPYPSGEGLHTGHVRGYTAMDIISRKRRMQGKNVLFPIGWDAFGLPTENFAIKTGKQPSLITKKNTDNFRKQFKSLGMSFDWSREVNTTDPKYYKWTQWIFLELFKKGLAYKAKTEVNWCPKDKIILANEESQGGVCERCGSQVEKREKEQWMLAITKYADRLDKDLDTVDYLPQIKLQQKNWIGRSEGAEINFPLVLKTKKPKFLILHGYTGHNNTRWRPWLKKELEKMGYEVELPQLPNTDNPTEEEQVDFVLKNSKLDEDTVIIGHSLGGVVAVKSLMKYNKKISGLVLVAPAIDPNFHRAEKRPFWDDFTWDFDYELIKKLTDGKIAVLSDIQEKHRVEYLKFLSEKLSAKLVETKARREHFRGDEEPEILDCVTLSAKIFTTRADTLFGATYLVLAPEHPYVQFFIGSSVLENTDEVKKYLENAKNKTEIERTDAGKEKAGVELKGIKAKNPASGEEIPVFIADYVLSNYGTGAIMAVPAHDERDFEFAKGHELLVRNVISPNIVGIGNTTRDSLSQDIENKLQRILRGEEISTEEGKLVNSHEFNGMKSEEARGKIAEKFGKKVVRYKLRDWIFSRQRYWGEPIPLIYCKDHGWQPVPEKDLPVKLPSVKNYKPTDTGESPLANIHKWVNTKCPVCKGPAKRETDVMPNWAGSSWYYLRYTDPKNSKNFADKKKLKYWTPVDWYNGGMEHTTLHLLYSRFWHKFLYDQKLVPTPEPYKKRTSHGLILAEGGEKMSKSKGNIINPDDIVKTWGADTLRLYEMFMGPFGDAIAWNADNMIGVRRFLERVWKLQSRSKSPKGGGIESLLHKTIKKVSEDIDEMKFNTAISAMMIFVNEAEKEDRISSQNFEMFLKILAPFAPHMAEEIWANLGHKSTIHLEAWPEAKQSKIKDEEVVIVVQINGKVRAELKLPQGSGELEAKEKALSMPEVKKWLEGKEIKKTIFVQDKILSFVVG